MDTGSADYCTTCVSPREEAGCNHPCRNSTQVWAESRDFVVIRDRKMCSCPDEFVHGLALPRGQVTGVEDPARPEGIWAYAWKAAAQRMPENEIALAVNPKGKRSQDQLHVHLVRVRRESLPSDPRKTARIDALNSVWQAAAGKASELAWQDYGILVVKGMNSGYLVVVDDGSPEYTFTRAECR
jgi:CDP-diacylglycerol pyrophosphatase